MEESARLEAAEVVIRVQLVHLGCDVLRHRAADAGLMTPFRAVADAGSAGGLHPGQ
ncbi:hypothetical protein AB0E10_41410 [Streptomyces sp. NPDC048045]|uniref:hypothetical protein n=1 Tax=Streptomyces sp. NPDC048045 TaxID=3154710 RepID=UPI003415ECD7